MTPTKSHLAEALKPFKKAFIAAEETIGPVRDRVSHVVKVTSYWLSYNDFVRAVEALTAYESEALTPVTDDAVRDKGEISDGYHTFNELYEHRHILFLGMLSASREKAWRSKLHADGTMFDGWFIAGLDTELGTATYHLPLRMWHLFDVIREIDKAPEWDGHTSNDVLVRLRDHALHYRAAQQNTKKWTRGELFEVIRCSLFKSGTKRPLEKASDVLEALITAGVIEVAAAPEISCGFSRGKCGKIPCVDCPENPIGATAEGNVS
jgi:hypothetical protein